MRPLTDAQKAVLYCEAGYSAFWRARVQRPSGTWVDLSDFEGRDFLESAEVSETIDGQVAMLNLRLKLEVDGLNLSPLVATSIANMDGASTSVLLDYERPVRVEVAVMPLDVQPTSSDWLPLFAGRIDVADPSGGHVAVQARDSAGQLQDRWLEAPLAIAAAGTTPVQTVMANAIAAAGLTSSWPLVTPVDPLWNPAPKPLEVGALLETLQRLADQIGWEVRLRWNSTASDWRLTFYGPNRSATAADWSFAPDFLRGSGPKSLPLDGARFRNPVEVVYSDRGDLDSKGVPKRKKATGTVVSSYSRRWMQVVESSSSNIDSTAEAQRMADAIVADLANLTLGASVEVDIHPCLELNDMVELQADDYHFTSAQTLAVKGITHRMGPKGLTTLLELRGKPSTSTYRWIALEARAFINMDAPQQAAPFATPSAPTSLAVTASPAGVVLTWKAADNGPPAASFEVHRSTTAAFTPSTSTLLGIANTTRFDVTGLTAGTTYYFKVVPRDAMENVGDASSEVTTAAGYVEPRAMQPYVTTASIIPNPDFEAQNDPDAPPDTWTFDGVWETDAIVDTAVSFTGNASVKFLGTGADNTHLVSQIFTVRAGRTYEFSVVMRQAAYGAVAAIAQVEWLGRDFLPVGVTTLNCGKTSGNLANFSEYTISDAAPSYGSGGVAAYARVKIWRTVATSDNVWVDSVELWRA